MITSKKIEGLTFSDDLKHMTYKNNSYKFMDNCGTESCKVCDFVDCHIHSRSTHTLVSCGINEFRCIRGLNTSGYWRMTPMVLDMVKVEPVQTKEDKELIDLIL